MVAKHSMSLTEERQTRLFPTIEDRKRPESALKTKAGRTERYVSSIWSFPGNGGEQLYRWYGTLPRSLVERLVSLYTRDGSHVLDPFAGLGTTLDVAADTQIRATGIDSNPLACLAAEARLHGIPQNASVLRAVEQVANAFRRVDSTKSVSGEKSWDTLLADAKYDYTKKWFRVDTLRSLLSLLFQIAEIEDLRIQRLSFVAAAQVTRHVASIDPRCTHHLVTKEKSYLDPLPLWRERVFQGLASVRTKPVDEARISVLQGSALSLKVEPNSVDFSLIHPPYLGMIHYHLIHRVATDLLDIVNLAKSPISLRKYDFGYVGLKSADVSTDNTEKYRIFIEDLAEVMANIVTQNGRCAVIIGDQRYQGRLRHPFTDFIECFLRRGFDLEENFIWVLQNNGGMHVLRRGHFLDHNYILVFHKAK